MESLKLVRAFYDYNEWADGHVLAAAGGLSAEDFSRETGTSFGSVETNLAHVVAAQVIWLSRWKTGVNPKPVLDVQDVHGYDVIRDAFDESHAELREYVDGLTDEAVGGNMVYRDSSGSQFDRPLWHLMVHLVNHGTHHRAETAMALTAMGCEPRPLDYSFFESERGVESGE